MNGSELCANKMIWLSGWATKAWKVVCSKLASANRQLTTEKNSAIHPRDRKRVSSAYGTLKQMIVRVGRENARDASAGIQFEFATREKHGKLMGIPLPTIDVEMPRLELKYSFMNTSGACDATTVEFFELLKLLARMAEIRTMVWRLAKEVRKTQRRVNALERIVIPDVEETRKFIEGVLEEREREVFFVQKILKSRLLGDRV